MYIMPYVTRIVVCLAAATAFASQRAEGAVGLELTPYLDGVLLPFLADSDATTESAPSPALATLFMDGFGCDTLATAKCMVNPATPGFTLPCCEWGNAALAPICPGKAHCGHVADADCNFEEQANTIYGFALAKRCRDVALLEGTTQASTTTTTTPVVSPSCFQTGSFAAPGAATCDNDAFSRVPAGGVLRVFDKTTNTSKWKTTDKPTRCTCDAACEDWDDCCHDVDQCPRYANSRYDTTTSTTTTVTTKVARTGSCKVANGGDRCGDESLIYRSATPIDGFCSCAPFCIKTVPMYTDAPPGANACCADFGTTCDAVLQDALLECPGDDGNSLERNRVIGKWTGEDTTVGCAAFSHHGRNTNLEPAHPVALALCPGSYEGGADACFTTTSTTTTITATTTTATTTTATTTTTSTTTTSTTTTITSLTDTTTTTHCTDAPGLDGEKWKDKEGKSCEDYAIISFWCKEFIGQWAEAMYAADQACCTCGGGFRTGGITPVTVALTTTATSTVSSTPTTSVSSTVTTTATTTATSSPSSTASSTVSTTASSTVATTASSTPTSTATSTPSTTASSTPTSTATSTPTTTYWDAKFVSREIAGTMNGAGFLSVPEETRCNVEAQKLSRILKQCDYDPNEGSGEAEIGVADEGSGEYSDDDWLEMETNSGIVCNRNNYIVVGNRNPNDPELVADILNTLVEEYQALHNNGAVDRVRATVDGFLVVKNETIEVINNLVLDSAKLLYYKCKLTSPSTTATTTATTTELVSAFTCVQDMSANLAGLYVSTNHVNCDRQAMFLETAARGCAATHGDEIKENQGLKCKDKSTVGTFFQGQTIKTCPLVLEALASMVEHYYQPNNPGFATFPGIDLFECTPSGFLRFKRCKTCGECSVAVDVLNQVVTAYQVDPSFRTCDMTTATSTQTTTATTTQSSTASTTASFTASSTATTTATSTQTSTVTTTQSSTSTSTQTTTATTTPSSSASTTASFTASSTATTTATSSLTTTVSSTVTTTATSTATTPLTCNDVLSRGNTPWQDDAGATCSTYVLLGFCDTGIKGAGGLSAAEACCECGGGLQQNNKELCEDNCASTLPVDYIANGVLKRCYCDASCERDGVCCHDRAGTCPTPEPIRAGGCIDKRLAGGSPWHDSNGDFYTCEAYGIADFCGANSVSGSTVIADAFEFGGMTARFACCACGGGQESTTTTATITSTVSTTTTTKTTTMTATSATSVTSTTGTNTTSTVTTSTVTTSTSTTATVTTATVTTTTNMATAPPATFAPGDCRAGESAGCKDCDVHTGACLRCRDGNYLLNGMCGDASACTAEGLIPTGKAMSGRACIAQDGLCAAPGCKPALTACEASKVAGPGNEMCTACEPGSFLVNGECKYRLTCKGPRFFETGAKCTCRHRKEDGGDVEKNCHRCHTYGSEKEGSYAALGPAFKHTFVKCYGCSGGYYFHDGSCVKKSDCPSTMVAYQGRNGYKNFCEPEFSCAGNKKQSGPNKGKSCECKEKNCAACDWRAGAAGYACTGCKRKQYLLNGACLSSPACIAAGGVPLGAESHGRICQTASGTNGGGRA